MKLKDLKKEEEKIAKRLQKYKNMIIQRISEDEKADIKNSNNIGFIVKLKDLNNGSLRVEDNVPALQFKNYISLIQKADSFEKLYEIITDYKTIMHEKLRINISPVFEDVLKEINKELSDD